MTEKRFNKFLKGMREKELCSNIKIEKLREEKKKELEEIENSIMRSRSISQN